MYTKKGYLLIVLFELATLSSCTLGQEGNSNPGNTPPPLPSPSPIASGLPQVSVDLQAFVAQHTPVSYVTALSALIREQSEIVVPSKIYHAGERSLLLRNIPSISRIDWDTHIMGDHTGSRYNLRPHARGFYGSVWMEGNIYGNSDDPWFVEVAIRDECRDPRQVVSLVHLDQDSRFSQWFGSHRGGFSSLNDLNTRCFDTLYGGFSIVNSDPCTDLLNQFLIETGVKIVFDEKFTSVPSFYIRDLHCIQSIRGSSSEMLNLISENSMLRAAAGIEDVGGGRVQETLFNLFYEDPALALSRIDFIESMSNQHRINNPPAGKWENLRNALLRCQMNGFDRLMWELDPGLGRSFRVSKASFINGSKFDRICYPGTSP